VTDRSTYLQRAASRRLDRMTWFREARRDRNLSLRELGAILGGVSPATLSRFERGYIPSSLVADAIDLWLDDDAEAARD